MNTTRGNGAHWFMARTAVVVIPLVLATSIARAEHLTTFRSAGSCVEYAVGITVDSRRAQALMPPGFTVATAGGKAIVSMFAQDCESSIDGGPTSRAIVSGVLVILDPLRSLAGCEAYDFAWGSSEPDARYVSMNDLGFRMDLIEDSAFSFTGSETVMAVPAADYAWRASASTWESPVRVPLTTVHCHVGPRGLVRGTYDHKLSALLGVGSVELGGGELWEALAAKSRRLAPGILFTFTWEGVTELLP